MKIIGIDCGLAITGWGIIEKTKILNQAVAIAYGAILTPKENTTQERIEMMYDELEGIIKKYNPDHIAIEELFFFKNQKTVIPVAESRGAVLLCAKKMHLETYEYTPLEVKQAVTSSGRAEKLQVQKMVKLLLNLKEIPKPDDTADALAIALTHSFIVRV
ncbi:MAG: crossover junction endodeoxyribonuclease RuvC [bacterium]